MTELNYPVTDMVADAVEKATEKYGDELFEPPDVMAFKEKVEKFLPDLDSVKQEIEDTGVTIGEIIYAANHQMQDIFYENAPAKGKVTIVIESINMNGHHLHDQIQLIINRMAIPKTERWYLVPDDDTWEGN